MPNEKEIVCANCGELASIGAKYCSTCGSGLSWNKENFNTKQQYKQNNRPNITFPSHPGNCEFPDCQYPGNTSHSTSGGGPYYCRFHFSYKSGPEATRIAEESRSKSNRYSYYLPEKNINKQRYGGTELEKAKKFVTRVPSREWALRILERFYKSEDVLWLPLKVAKQALEIEESSDADCH